jgi:hypothetical protein
MRPLCPRFLADASSLPGELLIEDESFPVAASLARVTVLPRRCAVPGMFAAKRRPDFGSRPVVKPAPATRNDLVACVAAFCAAFVLERLFRPFRRPMIVFYRQLPPYPDVAPKKSIPGPRQVA